MKQVPMTRFRREIRKYLRLEECIAITRNKVVVAVFLPVSTYDLMLKNIS